MSRPEVLNYLNSFGKFPLMIKDWKESDLNFTMLINEIKLEYLINYRINFCPHPVTREDIVCMYSVQKHTWKRYKTTSSNFTILDIQDMLRILRIPIDDVRDIVQGLFESALEVKLQRNMMIKHNQFDYYLLSFQKELQAWSLK